MAKKLISLFIATVMLCTLFPLGLTSVSAETEGYYTYTVTDSEATITKVDKQISGDVIIPSTLGGYPVTSLNNRPFEHCSSLKSVTIPEGVIYIGPASFQGCTSLESVTLPDSLITIGSAAFNLCNSLRSITIPKNVIKVELSSFYRCAGLEEIIVDEENTTYSSQDGALYNKDKTVLIKYPANNKDNPTLPNTVTTIDRLAFFNCLNMTEITIPEGVAKIDIAAFHSCTNLTSISMPNSLNILANSAFLECTSLKSITIPKNVSEIGDSAFLNCSNLEEIIVDKENAFYIIDNDILYNKDKTALIKCPAQKTDNPEIPSSVKILKDCAFADCAYITDIIIPNGVESVGSNTFSNCVSLKNLTIPNSVRYLNFSKFKSCNALTDVYYDGSPKEWSDITSDSFPERITVHCSRENEPYPTAAPTSTSAPTATPKPTPEVKPSSTPQPTEGYYTYTINDGKAAVTMVDNRISGDITVPSTLGGYPVTRIEMYAFEGCSNLTNVTIPDCITYVNSYAFRDCSELVNVIIPNSIEYFGIGVFCNCRKLNNIKLPDGLTSINYSMFRNCTSLTDITIPDTVTSIFTGAFFNCGSLTNIILPETLVDIDSGVFIHCAGLTSIYLPKSLENIDRLAFAKCTNLQEIIISEENKNYTFENGILYKKEKTELVLCIPKTAGDIIIPDTVTNIDTYSFYDCTNISTIKIPGSVISIGSGAFNNCKSLTDIYYGGSPKEWSAAMQNAQSLPKGTTVHYAREDEPEPTSPTAGPTSTPTATPTSAPSAKPSATPTAVPSATPTIAPSAKPSTAPTATPTIAPTAKPFEISNGVITKYNGSDTNLEIPSEIDGETITAIGYRAFCECDNLKNVTIPDSVTSIAADAFDYCHKLTNITIGSGVVDMNDAIGNCYQIENISVSEENKAYSSQDGILYNKDKTTLILCPAKKSGSYTIPDSVTTIDGFAFLNNVYLTNMVIPKNAVNIGDLSFASCPELANVTILSKITKLNYALFTDCIKLSSVVLPNSITSIDDYVFDGCESLTDVYFDGTKEEWNTITVGKGNNELLNANIHCLRDSEQSISPIGEYSNKITIKQSMTDDKVTFTITPIDNTDLSGVKLFAAGYSSDQVMSSIQIVTGVLSNGKLTLTSDLPKADIYKFMLWDKQEVPLINAITGLNN